MGDRPRERGIRSLRAGPAPLIRLRINQVEPLAGAAETEDGVEVAFDGWMELIGAIAELLSRTEEQERAMTDASERYTDEVPAPDPELRRLEPLIGSWEGLDHTRDTVLGGPGVPVTSRENFRWLEGGYFLVQEYETTFGDQPTQRGVNYWGYDSDAGTFRIIFFSNNGPFTEEGNRYAGRANGDRLTMIGPARFEYRLDDEGKIELDEDGRVSVSWWLRDEGGDWQPWMDNTFQASPAGPDDR